VLPGMIDRAQHDYHRAKAQLTVCDRAFRPVDLDDGFELGCLGQQIDGLEGILEVEAGALLGSHRCTREDTSVLCMMTEF
jgi:hypothetical protein